MREFGLIGYPLGHSFSKKYFSEKFCKEGIEAGYELFAIPDLDRDTLYRLLAEKPDLVGFNVTVPYKEKIAALCDSLSEDAAAIGAVNTVRVSRHSGGEISLHGYNTDWQAFRDSVKPVIAGGIRKALVLGTGGAAKAVVYALQSLQVDVTPVSRRRREGIIAYQDLNAAIMDEHKLIVNTSRNFCRKKVCAIMRKTVFYPLHSIGKGTALNLWNRKHRFVPKLPRFVNAF